MRLLTFCFALLLATIIYLANFGQARYVFALVREIPAGDKIAHFALYGMMSLLLNVTLAASRVRWGRIAILKGSLIVAVAATIDELSNLVVALRSFSLIDGICNYAGIVVGGWLAWQLVNRFQSREGDGDLLADQSLPI